MEPYILDETDDFAVVFKPARVHCAPLAGGGGDTLLGWYAAVFPPVMGLSGWKEGEGGLLHRLDFETQGLVLFAKNQRALDQLMALQEKGDFVKEYSAICQRADVPPSFPPPPFSFPPGEQGFVIESFFRPFGPGRKQVRPVIGEGKRSSDVAKDKGGFYRTEIVSFTAVGDIFVFTARLWRGFRHQIRCHLAWIGCPVLNDPLYGQAADGDFLALRSTALVFPDPLSGKPREYRIAPLEKTVNKM
jgi:23S rRNA pseudouridine1911/1915/1917 synthase